MFRRSSSVGDRFRDFMPMAALFCLASVSVFMAMNLLVTATPVLVDPGTAAPTSPPPSFAGTPSILPTPSALSDETPFPVASIPPFSPTIIGPAISERAPDGTWEVFLRFPNFRPGTTPWADQMNEAIRVEEQDKADRFALGPAAARQPGKVNHLSGDFEVDLLSPELAAFTLTWEDDTAAVVARGVDTIAFDLSTGQPIAFNSMFIEPDAALTILSKQSREMLYPLLGADWYEDTVNLGTNPIVDNFADWSPTPEGLRINFNQYQVADNGKLYSIIVPWSVLRPVMSTTGPVARLALAAA